MSKRKGLPKRRKRQGKTDYKFRLNLLKSGKPRMVIRRSIKNIMIQAVKYFPDGDKVLMTSTSKDLEKKFGVKTSRKNTTAAYLTGLMAGKKAKEMKITEAVPDTGLKKPHKKGAIMAAIKGLIDAGINIHHKDPDKIFPSQERMAGNHLKNKINFEEIKAKIIK